LFCKGSAFSFGVIVIRDLSLVCALVQLQRCARSDSLNSL
jgi:hypothetical protein